MDNMNEAIYYDYRSWVISFLFGRISFLIEFKEEIRESLSIIFKKRDLEAIKTLLETATGSPGLREKFFLMIQEIAQEESSTEKPEAEKKLFLYQLIIRKILTKEESFVIARILPSKIILSGVLRLNDLNQNEITEIEKLNKPFEK